MPVRYISSRNSESSTTIYFLIFLTSSLSVAKILGTANLTLRRDLEEGRSI
jgi:hypothetical protein